MAELLRYAKGTVEVDPVVLQMDVDDQLLGTDHEAIESATGAVTLGHARMTLSG